MSEAQVHIAPTARVLSWYLRIPRHRTGEMACHDEFLPRMACLLDGGEPVSFGLSTLLLRANKRG